MSRFAIIGGTGASKLIPGKVEQTTIVTPYGEPSGPLLTWSSGASEIMFLARHGAEGRIPPHRVNYRANVWALKESQPDFIVAINAVGGISSWARPGRWVIPDQLIDYSWGREHTYADGVDGPLQHIDFSSPFSESLRTRVMAEGRNLGLELSSSGTYAVTQGPRLETAAEIDRHERDGCHIVGMTAMPEAALSRELGMDYAICALVVNWAAGRGEPGEDIDAEIRRYIDQGMNQLGPVLNAL